VVALLNALSFALLAVAAVAFFRQRRLVLALAAVLFFPVAAAATVLIWWPISPVAAVLILAVTLGVPLVALAVFAIDFIWAPFCLEMTYLTFLCWILCPLAVLLNYAGPLACALLGLLSAD